MLGMILLIGKVAFNLFPEILMFHRIHEQSETTNMIEDQTRTREDLEMYELFWASNQLQW